MVIKKYYWLSLIFIIAYFRVEAQEIKVKVIDSGYIFNASPFKSCHASTIAELADHSLMVAYFGGDHEGSPDVCIWASIKNGKSWAAPIKLADGIQANGKQYACWNPVLFKARNNQLFLYYKVGLNPRTWWGMYKKSNDDGKTWSQAKKISANLLGPIKNKPIQLNNGDILYPSSVEDTDGKTWTVHLEKSNAKLTHWRSIKIDRDTFQAIQPTLLTYPSKLQLLARSRENIIVQSWSTDNGQTWSPLTATSLPNPNSGIDAVTSGHLQLLVYNPLSAGKNWWEGRSVLKLAASTDGMHWHDIYTFEDHDKGEFSYPAIIKDANGFINVTYTYNRSRIKYFKLSIQDSIPSDQ